MPPLLLLRCLHFSRPLPSAASLTQGKITCSIHQLSSLSSSGAAAGGTGAGSDGRRRRGRGGGDRKTSEMEAVVEAAFSSVVLLDLYPRSDVAVTVHVLEADGSLVCAVINAVSLALVQAGVQMRDLLVACAAGVVNKAVCCDLTAVEEGAAGGSGGCYLPMAVKASTQEVVYMQLDARLSLERLQDVTDRGLQGCDSVRRYVEEALREQIAGALERAER